MPLITKLLLRCVRGQLKRELHRIALEKETFKDHHHMDSDCGFQLLQELR